jgi:ketosteroid isomerase-like protein
MNTRRLLLVFVVTLFELSATSHLAKAQQPKTSRTPSEVREQWTSYWKARNLEGLRTLYTQDAVFISAVGERFDGSDQIGKHLEHVINSTENLIVLSDGPNGTGEASGDLVYDFGLIQFYSKTDKTVVKGFYVMVLKRDSQRQWRIVCQTLTQICCYTRSQS